MQLEIPKFNQFEVVTLLNQ